MTQPTPPPCRALRRVGDHPWHQGVAHIRHECTLDAPHSTGPHLCACGAIWPSRVMAQCSTCLEYRHITALRLRCARPGSANTVRYVCIDSTHPPTGPDLPPANARQPAQRPAAPPATPTPTPGTEWAASEDLAGAAAIVRGLLTILEQARPEAPPAPSAIVYHLVRVLDALRRHVNSDTVGQAVREFTRGPGPGGVGYGDVGDNWPAP